MGHREVLRFGRGEYGQSAAGRASAVRLKFAQAQAQVFNDCRVIAQAPVAGGAEQGRINRV